MKKTIKSLEEALAELERELELSTLELDGLKEIIEANKIANLQSTRNTIDSICKEQNMFCGIILTKELQTALFTMALEAKEDITIPFNVYYNK